MLLKAIVIGMDDSGYKAYITIPSMDGTSSKTDFSGVTKRLATVCILPGCHPYYSKGDVVFVEFEQGDTNDPVIVGQLYRNQKNDSTVDLYAESINVHVNAEVPDDFLIDGKSVNKIIKENVSYTESSPKDSIKLSDITDADVAEFSWEDSNNQVHSYDIVIQRS